MATHRISLLNGATAPDTSGSLYAELSSQNLNSNDLTPTFVWVFTDSGTDLDLRFAIQVPQNYVGTAKIVVLTATTATTGNVAFNAAYNSIANGESFDPAAVTETVGSGSGVAVPATARLLKEISLSLTSTNLAAGDTLLGVIRRQGSNAADTLAASAYLVDAFFEYADA